jgi:hypothetical protein
VNPLSSHRTRRATTDDLEPLKALWLAERLDAGELEKQLTDFQVGEDEQGAVAAAIALQISGSQGRIHSETIADFAQTDLWRPRLWFQLQSAAKITGCSGSGPGKPRRFGGGTPGSPTPPANGWKSCRSISARPARDGWPCASGMKRLSRRRWSGNSKSSKSPSRRNGTRFFVGQPPALPRNLHRDTAFCLRFPAAPLGLQTQNAVSGRGFCEQICNSENSLVERRFLLPRHDSRVIFPGPLRPPFTTH